ncbi:DNA cytosine methyltransferase [Parabacteroides distasonis]|uniref:DNA cytosine methyltransferase n=1 Tax=Parabacteroides distasonis TaxID=823 RepID=UPI003219B50C
MFNTAWFLPQNRERIYLVGRVADRCTGDVFPFPAPGGGNHPCRKDTVHSHTCGTITRNYYKQPNFGNYLINLQPGETFDGQPNEEQKSRIRMLTEVECERLQGFPDDFTRYGIINGEVREISRANRYAMLGNAVSVPVVRAVAERIRNSTVLND